MERELPTFSIVVPTYANTHRLAACLEALACLSYPVDRFEVLVVDDGSPAPPGPEIDSFRGRIDLKLLTQSHAGPAAARNTGAARAKGEFLAFTDDDCAPEPNWLARLAACLSTRPECGAGGRTVNALADNPYSAASQMLVDYLYTYYNVDPNRASFFTSNNLALPKERFHDIGGFDSNFARPAGEDREFCDRWLRHGHRMIYTPQALVYHAHRLNFRTFFKQHFHYGCGAAYFRRIRSRNRRERIRVEPLGFYLNLPGFPLTQTRDRRALLLTVLLAISQGANAAGFLWGSIRGSETTAGPRARVQWRLLTSR